MPDGPIKSCRDLLVWQKGMQAAVRVNRLTDDFPAKEQWSLINQMRRSGLSIPCNIAESWGRGSTGDYVRFLSIARGSLMELETQTIYAEMLGYLEEKTVDAFLGELAEISKMLTALINKLKATS